MKRVPLVRLRVYTLYIPLEEAHYGKAQIYMYVCSLYTDMFLCVAILFYMTQAGTPAWAVHLMYRIDRLENKLEVIVQPVYFSTATNTTPTYTSTTTYTPTYTSTATNTTPTYASTIHTTALAPVTAPTSSDTLNQLPDGIVSITDG